MKKINIGNDLYLKGRIGWRGLSKEEYLDHSDYKIINATALMDGYVDWENCGYISENRYLESPEIMLQEGDILISKDGTLGKIGYVKNITNPCTVASGVFVLRNTKTDTVDFDYLYHVLKSNIFKDFIKRNKAIGSTISHLYQTDLANFEINLPSLKEQRDIAKVLNVIDDKVANNWEITSNLEKIAKLIYDYWFVQFDFPDENGNPYKSSGGKMVWNEELKREIPEGWGTQKISSILGKYPKTISVNRDDYAKGDIYPIVDQSKDYICGYTNDKSKVLHMTDAIVFGDHTNIAKYVNFDFARGADGTQIINSNNKRLPNYLLYLQILSLPKIEQGYSRHFKFLKEQIVILPDSKITNRFMSIVDDMLLKTQNCIEENRQLTSLRDFLLPMLMNGQVKIREESTNA